MSQGAETTEEVARTVEVGGARKVGPEKREVSARGTAGRGTEDAVSASGHLATHDEPA
jgi:hypothetical protein